MCMLWAMTWSKVEACDLLTLTYVTKHKTTQNCHSQQKSIPKQIICSEKGVFSTLTTPGELAEKNLSCFNQYVALEIN